MIDGDLEDQPYYLSQPQKFAQYKCGLDEGVVLV